MPDVPLPLVGQSARHRSLPLSAQTLRGWWPEINQDGEAVISLMPTPGYTLFSDGSSQGADRGAHRFQNVLYKVSGTTLYSVDSSGTQTSIGTISGLGRCIFANDGTSLVIVTGGLVYEYNGTTLSVATDSDFETPYTVAYLNNQMLYDGDGGRFAVSDAGAPTTINSLNYASAESSPGNLIRCYTFNQTFYPMCEDRIESWYNSGVGDPPFDRIEGGIIQVGLGARHSAANNEKFMYFLGNDCNVYRLVGSQEQSITNSSLANAIEGYSTVDDAIGFCFKIEAQNFYFLTFPTANKTWVFSESAQMWFQMSTGVGDVRHQASSYCFCYGKHLITDYSNGNVYEWDLDAFDDNGSTIQRVRDTAVIDGALLGPQFIGKPIFMSGLEIIMETGVGFPTGQGQTPELMIQWSDDGGRTFSNEVRGMVGRGGEYQTRVQFHALGMFHSRIIRITCTDPVAWALYRMTASIEVGDG